MKYKVHYAYINIKGQTIPAGVYEEEQLDLAEARNKTILTLYDIPDQVKVEKVSDDIGVKVFNPRVANDFDGIKELKLEQEQSKVEKTAIKINSAHEDLIAAIKYVSQKTAKQVVELRAEKPFVSYVDLDERVPLKFNRKWQDLANIEFDYSKGDTLVKYE